MEQVEELAWTPFAERPEWRQFAVRRMSPTSKPVVSIKYSPEHEETLAYFYTAVENGELSLRVLQLTEEVSSMPTDSVSQMHFGV